MVTKRITDQSDIEDGEIIEGKHDNITALEDDLDEQLARITSEFDKDVNDVEFMVKVYKALPNSAELEYLFSCTPSELPIVDRLRDEYGGGNYQARVYRNKKLHRRMSYRIGAPRPFAQQFHQQNKGNDETAALVRAMMEQQQKQMEQFQSMMMTMVSRAAPAPATNISDMMSGVASMMGVMSQMIPKAAPESGGVDTLVKGMTLARELMGDQQSGGERNFYDTITETVKTFGPVMAGALTNPTPRERASAPTTQAPRPPNTAPPVLPKPTQQPEEDKMKAAQMAQLKLYTGLLVQKAAEGSDPGLYAELILDNVGDDELKFFLTSDTGLDNLVSVHPGVNQHRQWFESLRGEVIALLTEEAEGAKVALKPSVEPVDNGGKPTTSDS